MLAYACTPASNKTRFEDAAPPTTQSPTPTTSHPPSEKPVEPQPVWQALDEPGVGGRVTALAVDPTDSKRLLVGGDLVGAGLSTDGGDSWQQTFGLTNTEMARFTFHPAEPREVWVGTMGGPYVSLDGGRTWEPRRDGMGELRDIGYSAPIEEILVDPANPDRLLAFGGSHREWNAPGTSGWGIVWESLDRGAAWQPIATIADGTNILDATWLADGTLAVAALQQGIFRSTDGGRTWVPADTGLPDQNVRALAAHPTNAAVLWAAMGSAQTESGVTAGGVWKSTDGAASWQPSSNGLDLTTSVGVGPDFAPRYLVLAVAPTDPDVLLTSNLAYGAEGVFRSTDGAASWTEVLGTRTINRPSTAYNTPISATAVAFDPNDARFAVIGNAEFVLATTDGGNRWRDITSDTARDGTAAGRGYSGLVANRVEFSPDGGELLLCGFDGANPLVSDTNGQNWSRPLSQSDPWGGCLDAAYSLTVSGRRYVLLGQNGAFGGVAVLEADDTFRVSVGADRGLPERYAALGVVDGAVAVVREQNGTETVVIALGGILYRSVDGGATFSPVETSLGAIELVADPTAPGRLYVAGSSGVWVSDDGATTFRLLAGSPRQAVRLTLDPGTERLYAAVWRTVDAGLWRFDGSTWAQILAEPSTHDVAVDPANPQHLLVATNDHPFHDVTSSVGMLSSMDGGATWVPLNSGLPMLRVSTVEFDPKGGGRAVIGTFGRGYFVTTGAP